MADAGDGADTGIDEIIAALEVALGGEPIKYTAPNAGGGDRRQQIIVGGAAVIDPRQAGLDRKARHARSQQLTSRIERDRGSRLAAVRVAHHDAGVSGVAKDREIGETE